MAAKIYRIHNVPNFRLRIFKINNMRQLPPTIRLRGGLSLFDVAKKVKIEQKALTEFGISDAGIDKAQLMSALERQIPEQMGTRRNDERTPEAIAGIIIGRIGRKEDVLTLDINSNVKDKKGFRNCVRALSFDAQMDFMTYAIMRSGYSTAGEIETAFQFSLLVFEHPSYECGLFAGRLIHIILQFHPEKDPEKMIAIMSRIDEYEAISAEFGQGFSTAAFADYPEKDLIDVPPISEEHKKRLIDLGMIRYLELVLPPEEEQNEAE